MMSVFLRVRIPYSIPKYSMREGEKGRGGGKITLLLERCRQSIHFQVRWNK